MNDDKNEELCVPALFPLSSLHLSPVSILQLIPGIASVPFYSTLIPLVGVLGVTAVKDAYDDIVSSFLC